jgi:hypothetical protein
VTATSPTAAVGAKAQVSVDCPAGKKVLGTSGYWLYNSVAPQIWNADTQLSHRSAEGINPGPMADSITLEVVCANVS